MRPIMIYAIVLAFGIVLGACKDKNSQNNEIIRSVKTITVTKALTSGNRQLSGVLKPAEESDLSFQVGGTVDKVEVKLGDAVEKGQLLAAIDPRDYELKKQSAQAEVASAKATLATASEHLKRQEKLKKGDYASQATLESAQASYESALSKEKMAISALEEADRDLKRTKLEAPFEGKISLRQIEPHQETQAGRVIFKLQSKEGLKAEVLVPESLIRDLTPKQVVQIQFPTLKDLQVPGTIREISAQSNAGNAFPVTIDLSETPSDLRAGMSVQILFSASTSVKKDDSKQNGTHIYLVPLTAIDTRVEAKQPPDGKGQILSVFLFDQAKSIVKRQQVTIQNIQGNQVEVISGLKEGDVLVTAGVPFLEDGQKVNLWRPKYRSPELDQ